MRLMATRLLAFPMILVTLCRGLPAWADYTMGLSVSVSEVGGDPAGEMTVSWNDFREKLQEQMTVTEWRSCDPSQKLRFTVKRRRGYGDFHLPVHFDETTVPEVDVLTDDLEETSYCDKEFGTLPGNEPIHYWVEATGFGNGGTTTWTVAGHIKTRRKNSISIGLSWFSSKGWGEDKAKEMEHEHDGQEALLFHELVGGTQISEALYMAPSTLHPYGMTAEVMSNLFDRVSAGCRPGDSVYFFLATHGNEKSFALYDKECPAGWLKTCVSYFKGKGVRFLGVLNACHSGALIRQFDCPEYSFTSWIAAADAPEIAHCFNTLSGFGRTFLKWGWQEGYGKIESVYTADDECVATGADPDSEYVTAYEAAHYADLIFPGASSKYEQHFQYVNEDMLKKWPLKKVTEIPEAWTDRDYPVDLFRQDANKDVQGDRIVLPMAAVGDEYKDFILKIDWGKSLRWDWDDWFTFYTGELGDTGMIFYTKKQYEITHAPQDGKNVANAELAASRFLEPGQTYILRGQLLYPQGWTKAGNRVNGNTCKIVTPEDAVYAKYTLQQGMVESQATLPLGDNLVTCTFATEKTRDGAVKANVRFRNENTGDETCEYDFYGQISESGDSYHFNANDKMANNISHVYPWLNSGDDAFYFTVTPDRLSCHFANRDFKAPLYLQESYRQTPELTPWELEGMVHSLESRTKAFDASEASEWEDDEKWVPSAGYNVKVTILLEPMGGTCSESIRTVRMASAVGTLPVPKKAGCDFAGWYTSPYGGDLADSATYALHDMTYYAHWDEQDSSEQWYVGVTTVDGDQGGTVTGGNAYYSEGEKVNLTAKPAAGHVFSGWFVDGSGLTPVRDAADWQEPDYVYRVQPCHTNLFARFISVTSDWATVSCSRELSFRTGEPIVPVAFDVQSGSRSTLKVTGLPAGLKFATQPVTTRTTTGKGQDRVTTLVTNALPNTIYGTPTKSGVYTVVATATTATRRTASCSQTVVVRKTGENVVKAEVALVDAEGRRIDGAAAPGKVTGAGVCAAGRKVTLKATANRGFVFAGWWEGAVGGGEGPAALPNGDPVSRLASYTLAGMPTNDVIYTAAFVTAAEDKSNIVATVNGMAFETGRSGIAPCLTTNIWAGVYLEWPVVASALSAATVKVAGLPGGLKFTAKPVTAKTTSGSGKTKVTTVTTNIPANTIYGAPSAASKTAKDKMTGAVAATPSQVKVTVATAGKSSQTFEIDMTVDPLPAWAVGTFTGPSYAVGDGTPTLPDMADGSSGAATLSDVVGSALRSDRAETNGSVSVTIAASGKISAKQPVNGKTVSFVANCFDRYDADEEAFHAMLTAKVGKEVVTNEMVVCGGLIEAALPTDAGGTRSVASVTNGYIEADLFDAWQYNWKSEPWKSIVKVLDRESFTYVILADGTIVDEDDGGEGLAALPGDVTGADGVRALPVDGANVTGKVTLKFAASGAVTVTGEFAQLDADGEPVYKKGKPQTVKATGSATLVPAGEDYGLVFVYLAPKGLQPHARCVEASWAEHIVTWEYGEIKHEYVCFKPVIYLYPETNTTCNVRLALNGELTCTYPEHGTDGWRDFIASPDGTLTFPNGSRYYCLYWEGETDAEWDLSRGYCVKGSETASFLADILLEIGLTFREANEFIVYWLPLMQDNPYNVISFQGENYANAAKLSVDPQPDSLLRVFMAWCPSDRFVDISAPVIVPFDRKGFTVVEWGGTKVGDVDFAAVRRILTRR